MPPRCPRFFTWTATFRVQAVWVADGFDLDDARLHDILSRYALPMATAGEIRARVLHAPNPDALRKEWGESQVPATARRQGWYTWTVRISIAKVWVEDGFVLDADRIESLLQHELGHARGDEVGGRVCTGPSAETCDRWLSGARRRRIAA